MKILITGANSFLGRNFIRHSRFNQIDEVSLIENKPEDVNFSRFDVVIHLAALVHQSKKTPEFLYFRINRDLCLKVAENAKKSGVRQFIFLSSVKVYGDQDYNSGIITEESPCHPTDSYGKSKFEAETGLRLLETDKFIVSIIRTPLVYGDGVKANMLNLIKLVEKFPILPFRDIENKRSMTFVKNLVGFIDRIIELKSSGTFIAIDQTSLSTTELVMHISSYLNKKVILIRLPIFLLKIAKLIFPSIFMRLFGSLVFDNQKTLEKLSFKPQFSAEEGLRDMVEAYRINKKIKKSN